MEKSSDDEMNVLSGMYGIKDKQNFQKQNNLQIIHVLMINPEVIQI